MAGAFQSSTDHSRLPLEGRKIVEEEREALWHAIDFADHHFGIGAFAEQLGVERGVIETHFVGKLFIVGERANEARDQRQVGAGGGAYGKGHAGALSGADAVVNFRGRSTSGSDR